MDQPVDLRVVELLSARLCHDLVGPIAAISNGVELMSDDDPDFARDAVALVGDSAHRAATRLQFYRFAFGYRQGGTAGPQPHALAGELFESSAILCDYGEAVQEMGLDWQKLVCNLLLVASEALPRGGRLIVGAGADGPELEAIGEGKGPGPEIRAALALEPPVAELTARTVVAYFAGLLGRALGCRIAVADAPGSFQFCVVKLSQQSTQG
ncbi:MAG TPA: histidine phosphotransferase family protein [Stellaceae bacterium]|nr:histidine phosphotransferase family protein [Stellaceae bacterium]